MRELIARIVAAHPDFAAEVEGCSEDELAELEGWIGRPLPDDYRAVLELMGRRLGRAAPVWTVEVHDGGAVTVEHRPLLADYAHLQQLHRPRKRGRRSRAPSGGRHLAIATSPQAQDLGYFYLTLDDDPPRVVHLDSEGEPYAGPVSLPAFFFARAFGREVRKRRHELGP